MDIGLPHRTPWRQFPDVVILAAEAEVKRNPDYPAAKAGNIAAARQLVSGSADSHSLSRIAALLPHNQVTVTSVHAFEAEGINRIPTVLAELLSARLHLSVEASIVQINRVGHTGASGYRRLAFPALFDGHVEPGRCYLLVDDFVGQGGTLANFRGFIESQGGDAALAVTLTGKPYSATLTLTKDTLRRLRDRHGPELEEWWKEVYGYGFDCLTESEARYLSRADSAQLIRDRILAARQGGNA